MNVEGATAINNTLDVAGATTLYDTLNVEGATAINNTLDVAGATTLYDTLDVKGNTTLATLTMGDVTVNGIDDGADAQTTGGETVLATIASVLKSAENATFTADTNAVNVSDGTIHNAITSLDNAIGSHVTQEYNGVASTNSVNENIDAINKVVGDFAGLNDSANLKNGATNPATIVDALNNIDATLGNVHGLGTGANGNLSGETVESHLLAIDQAIGNRNYGDSNIHVADGDSVAVAVSKLDATIGDFDSTVEHHTVDKTKAVNQNLSLIDSVIGDRNIVSKNAAINEAVAQDYATAFKTTGDLIGDMKFDDSKYISGVASLSDAVRSLDSNLGRVEHKVHKIEKEAHSGLAAVTAMTALVPNARDCGDTQISVGTGAYADRMGIAAGAFHYINDHVLLNAGGSYGGDKQWAVRAGITFGL